MTCTSAQCSWSGGCPPTGLLSQWQQFFWFAWRAKGPKPGDSDSAKLADELAAALRAIRGGHVPHRIWWEPGPARALLAYQAL